jgi:iron complex transport system permease protein
MGMGLSSRHKMMWSVMSIVLIMSIVLSLTSGPMDLPVGQSLLAVWDGLFHTQFSQLASHEQLVIWEIRWYRTLLAIFIGALLAICGAVTQGLFRNPLADPGIIGVSTGAGLGAAIAIVLLPVSLALYITPLAAFLGGLLTTFIVYKLAQSATGTTSVLILLLSGVAVAAFSGALIGFLTFIANDQALRDLTLWGMGSLNASNHFSVWLSGGAVVVLLVFFQRHAGALNALLLGEAEAQHLGIDVERLKVHLIVITAVGIGIAVAATGIIGFVGLVIPHFIRMILGPNHHRLLPLSALSGAGLLLLADVGARVFMAPAELPVGVITALIGAPFFIFLLMQQKHRLSVN